jgi:uncharacterized protein (TIGR02145 family)
LEELKVRWKKASLENCPGVPCPSLGPPGPCSSIVATPTGPSSVSVSFVPPTSDGGSPITGYVVTATTAGPSAPAKRKSSAIITATGTAPPIIVTGLTLGVNYIFTVLATNAVGPSPTIVTITTVKPCVINTATAASSSPTLTANAILTNITHSTTIATGIGTATGLPAGVTASWSAGTITISGTPTVTGTFNYTIPLTGGCGSVNATGTITVTPAAAFTPCSTMPLFAVDGSFYTIVTIGTQCWTKENLRVRKYNDGTDIRFDKSGGTAGGAAQTWTGMGLDYGAYTIYAHDSTGSGPGAISNLANYGYMYNYYAVAGIITVGGTSTKNICPTGYHVPTDSDWNKLVKFIDSGADTTINAQSSSAGTKLKKDATLWTTNSGTDDYGFSALPGGYRNSSGSFSDIRDFALYWSATENGISDAWSRDLLFLNGSVGRGNSGKVVGASVRCLRD